jgi:ATP-dependent Clp protease ATP-binding subunit ClpC
VAALWRRGRAVPLSLVRDLLDLTGGRSVEGPCARLAGHPGMRALASLHWPAEARVALAVLLLRDAHDPAFAPPEGTTPTELRWHLTAALDAPECPPAPAPAVLLPVEHALATVDERLLTLLEGLGADACARDPALPLTLLPRLAEIVPLDAPQRRLLDLRLPATRPGRALGAGPGPEPGGFAPHGDLRRLVPTQWVLPEVVRRWRHVNGGLLYRTRLGHEPPRLRPAVIVLDVSPTCVGPVERVLRPAAHALAVALLDAGAPGWLVAAGGDDLVRPLQHRLDLFEILARRAATPVDAARTLDRVRGLREALRDHGPSEPVVVLLSQPWFGAEERDVPAPPHLRALFVHYPGRPVRPAWHDRCERWTCVPCDDPPELGPVLADLAG